MNTILITDDEKIEREGILRLIRKFGFELEAILAENGEAALEIIRSRPIDILITDIKMPFMDGLELAEKASVVNPDLEIIIYSAFGEFDYAKRALRTNVSNYLLKPIVIPEFMKVMEYAISKCNERKEVRINHEKLLDGYHKGITYEKEKLLLDALNGWHQEGDQYDRGIELIDKEYKGQWTQLSLLDVGRRFFDSSNQEFTALLTQMLPWPFDYLNLNEQQSVILIRKAITFEREELQQCGNDLLEEIWRRYQINGALIFGEQVERLDDLAQSFSQAEQTLDFKFFFEGRIVLFANEQLGASTVSSSPIEMEVQEILEKINQCIDYQDKLGAKTSIEVLFNSLKSSGNSSVIYIKFICSEIMHKIVSSRLKIPKPQLEQWLQQIFRTDALTELKLILCSAVDHLQTSEESASEDQRTHQIVRRVKQIVENEYMQQDISLEYIAEQVYLRPSYLSYLFKKESGKSLVRYITSIRMTKAAELLEKSIGMKITDISELLGYRNSSYFIQTFKNHYGISPAKYREQRA